MPGGAAAAQKGTHVPSARLQSSTWKRDEVRAVQNGRQDWGRGEEKLGQGTPSPEEAKPERSKGS